MTLHFGKYKNIEISQVPESYLIWALESATILRPTQREAIRQRLGLAPESAAAGHLAETVRASLRDVYRQMSMKFHPDKGGSTEAMIAVNHMHECLQETLSRRLPKPSGP